MKSKKWLISLGLAVVLVVAFTLPACEPTPTEYWYTPAGDKISFEIATMGGAYGNISLMVVEDLQDFGLDVDSVVLDSATFYDYLYYGPHEGGIDAFIFRENPGPDPWADWIWVMLADPESWGLWWNPCWYDNEYYDELMLANYLSSNMSVKQDILFEIQEVLAQDVPIHFLMRDYFISVRRTDNWDNWFNEMDGLVSCINEWSIRECTKLGDETQLKVGTLLAPMFSLDMHQPNLMHTDIGALYLMLVYENLIYFPKIDEDLGAAYDCVPKLATSWSWSYEADGAGGQNQILTMNLREGVKWHDGENFTADDVVYSVKNLMYSLGPTGPYWFSNGPINWTAAENEGEILPEHMLVTKTDTCQVEFRFIEGWHQNEYYLPVWMMGWAIVPEHIFNAEGAPEDPWRWAGNYTGTGPYRVKEFVAHNYLLLEHNDDYWGPLPEAEEILFQLYNDSEPMFLALEAGDIDVVMDFSVPLEKVANYEANPDLEVEIVPDLRVNYLGFNLHPTGGYEPLQDVVLRQAIAYAIDKQDIVDILMGGYAEVPYTWVYNESPSFNPDLAKYDYNITAAENLLLAANYTKHA